MSRIGLVFLLLSAILLAVPPTPTDGTPEPATLVLLGAGGAAYGLYKRYKE